MFKALKDVLPGMIDELGISEQLKGAAVFAAWRTVAARLPPHARAARPSRFQHGTLVVEVSSSSAVHELHMRIPQLTREVNRIVGRPLVTKLEFRVRGRRPPTRAAAGMHTPSPPVTPSKKATTEGDADRERRLRQAIDLIENPVVRQQALARLSAEEEQTDRCTLCGTVVSTPGLCPLCQAHEEQESAE